MASSGPDGALLAVIEPLRRVVASRVADPHAAEDLVQETLARLLERRYRFDDDALLPYAIATARNLIISAERAADMQRRHAPRLIDLTPPTQPEEQALDKAEAVALSRALSALPAGDRHVLVSHEVAGTDTAALAAESGATPGAVAAKLGRTRAHLRVNYLLAFRRVALPSATCRNVLISLSAGDRRRQRALDAGGHLLCCPTCANLAELLTTRSRALAGLVALPTAMFGRLLHSRAAQISTAATAVAATAVIGVLLIPDRAPPPAPPAAYLSADGQPLMPWPGPSGLGPHVNQTVTAVSAPVWLPAAPDGLWIGESPAQRLWVEVADTVAGTPMLPPLTPGARVSFTGRIAENTPAFLAEAGEDGFEGYQLLVQQGFHIEVLPSDLHPG